MKAFGSIFFFESIFIVMALLNVTINFRCRWLEHQRVVDEPAVSSLSANPAGVSHLQRINGASKSTIRFNRAVVINQLFFSNKAVLF